jgi:hypothetical protein
MRYVFFVIVFLVNTISSWTQEISLTGVLYEHNSKTNTGKLKPIVNAQIVIERSVPSVSDNLGKFKTRLNGYKYGETAHISVKKPGYEVVNRKEIEDYLVGATDELKVYLAPKNMLYEAQMKYYNIAKKSIEAGYHEKLNRLTAELKNFQSSKLNSETDIENFNAEFQRKTKDAENQRKTALKNADEIARKIAEINLDFAEKTYKQAIDYFVKGNIDSCLVLLNSKYFANETRKSLSAISDLKKSIKEESKVILRVIDRELFRAQLYETKFQEDSVSVILKRISNLSFSLIESLDVDAFLRIQNKVINFDPYFRFEWINTEYFEDLIALVRIKFGRGSLAEAEALRLFGIYQMRKGDEKNSMNLFLKSLDLLNKNGVRDSANVLTNIMEHGTLFLANSRSNSMFYFANANSIEFESNPYWFAQVYNDNSDIEYSIPVLIKRYQQMGNSHRLQNFINNALSYVLRDEVKRDFSNSFIDYLRFIKIEIYAQRNNGILLEHIEAFKEMESRLNVGSIEYVNLMDRMAQLYFEEIFPIQNRNEDFSKEIFDHVKDIFKEYDQNEFLTSLTGFNRVKYFISKMGFSFILWKAKSDMITVERISEDFNSLSSVMDIKVFGLNFLADYLYIYYRMGLKYMGCWPDETQMLFHEYAQHSYEKQTGINGVKLNKIILDYSFICEDTLTKDSKMISRLESCIADVFDDFINDSTNNEVLIYGLLFNANFEGDQSEFQHKRSLDEFYYGSDYARKIGRTGLVSLFNSFDIRDSLCDVDDYSLWRDYSLKLFYGDSTHKELEMINTKSKCSLQNVISDSETIDSLQFTDSMIFRERVSRVPLTPATSVYYNFGNSILDHLDFLFFKISYLSQLNGDYQKCIDNLYKFIRLGMPQFEIGYSICYGNPTTYFNWLYLWGIRSSMLLGDKSAYEFFTNSYNSLYSEISPKMRLLGLNELFWVVFDEKEFFVKGEWINLDYNTTFFKEKYSDFCRLNADQEIVDTDSGVKGDFIFNVKKEQNVMENFLTLSLNVDMENFDFSIIDKMKVMYPNEARVYRNAAYYYFRKGEQRAALEELDKAIGLGFMKPEFFTNRGELKKYHKKIISRFEGIKN